MKSLVIVLCFAIVARGFPSYEYPIHPGVGAIYKGPNSETIIKGPDGSIITAEAEGGEVALNLEKQPIVVDDPAVVAEASPIVAEARAVVVDQEVFASAGPTVTHQEIISEPAVVDSVDVEIESTADLVGPSGIVSTRGSHSIVSGPASTSIDGQEVGSVFNEHAVNPVSVVSEDVNVNAAVSQEIVNQPLLTNVVNSVPEDGSISVVAQERTGYGAAPVYSNVNAEGLSAFASAQNGGDVALPSVELAENPHVIDTYSAGNLVQDAEYQNFAEKVYYGLGNSGEINVVPIQPQERVEIPEFHEVVHANDVDPAVVANSQRLNVDRHEISVPISRNLLLSGSPSIIKTGPSLFRPAVAAQAIPVVQRTINEAAVQIGNHVPIYKATPIGHHHSVW